MSQLVSRRSLLAAGVGVLGGGLAASAADTAPAKGAVTLESLGKLLGGLGLNPEKSESRFDFAFASKIDKEDEWELSMSVVLSTDTKTIWLMAWLDELPQSAVDVPRTALLRLLADNDRIGNGQFFAYVSENKRFVLQRVIPNENITAAGLRDILVELGKNVAGTHAHWSVANWKQADGTSTVSGTAPANNAVTPANNTAKSAPKATAPSTTSSKTAAPQTATKSTTPTKPAAVKK